eukprot:12443153-Alexandrium_andersonii.AAC.1
MRCASSAWLCECEGVRRVKCDVQHTSAHHSTLQCALRTVGPGEACPAAHCAHHAPGTSALSACAQSDRGRIQ